MSFADQRAERIVAHLTGAGYARCEPPILQPASIFFDSGEELRGQLYLTSDLSGADYCLRPEDDLISVFGPAVETSGSR